MAHSQKHSSLSLSLSLSYRSGLKHEIQKPKTKNTQKGEPLTPIKASSGSIIQDTDIQKGVKTIFYDLSRGALEDYVNLHISEVCRRGGEVVVYI
jgi:hypothetical protein